jgi:hypothetical protein
LNVLFRKSRLRRGIFLSCGQEVVVADFSQ